MPNKFENLNHPLKESSKPINHRSKNKGAGWIFVLSIVLSIGAHVAFPYSQDLHFKIDKPESRSEVEFIALPDKELDLLADIEDKKVESENELEEEPEIKESEAVANAKNPLDELPKDIPNETPKKIAKKPQKETNKSQKKLLESIRKSQIENQLLAKSKVKKHFETARERRSREWLEARAKEKASRAGGRQKFLKRKAKKQKKVYKAPPASMKKGGSPRDAWVCNASDKGFKAQIKAEKGIKKWISYATAVLATYQTKPSLGRHFSRVTYVRSRKKEYIGKLGPKEFIMPKGTIQVELDSPRRGRLVLARKDVRCLIGVRYIRKKLFPITLYRVPAQFYLGSKKVSQVLINFTLERDGRYSIKANIPSDRILSNFRNGRLKNHKLISKNIDLHFFAAEAAQGIGKLFGLELIPTNKKKKK